MSVNKPNLTDNPEPEAHPTNDGGGHDHPSDTNTKSNIQLASNLSSSAGGNLNSGADCTKCSMTNQSLSPLAQFQMYGGINARLVNLGRKQLQTKGLKSFEHFDKVADEFDTALRLLGSSVQLFGSSVGVLHATCQLRNALSTFRHHFRRNAASLYESVKPNERIFWEIKPEVQGNGQTIKFDSHNLSTYRSRFKLLSEQSNGQQTQAIGTDPSDNIHQSRKPIENKLDASIAGSMSQVQKGLLEFVNKINEISGFQDESINRTFKHFAEELIYRVGALERLNYDRNKALQWRMNELTAAYGQHLGGMCHALQSFQKTSIPIIQRAQEHRGLGLQGLSAVATFFSGITASAIQYEISDIPTPLQSAVNGLWILSLACSVASAVSAQAVFFWCTSKFSSPTTYTPGFIGRVLLYTPLAYLSCSVFTFMVGLSVFTFSSEQHIVLSVLVTAFTGIVSFKLVIFGSWITLERLAYSQTKGEHWLLQIPMSRFARDTVRYLASKTKPSKRSGAAQEPTNPKPDDDAEKGSQPKSQPSSKLDRRAPSKSRKETLRAIIQSKKISDFKDQYRNLGRESSIYVTHADKVYINNLKLSAVVPQHNGLIKHLAFNPKDQSLLATCGWDGRALISSINQNISLKFPLDHGQNNGKDSSDQPRDDQQSPTVGKPPIEEASAHVREVAWSLDGMMLATRTREVVRIWDAENGNLLKTIQRNTTKHSRRTIEGIAWTTFINENNSPQSNGEKHESEDKNKRKDEGRESNTTRGETNEAPRNKRKDKDKLKPCLLVIEHVYELEANQLVVKSTDITRHYLPTQDTSYRDLKSAWSNSKDVTANVPTNIISVGVVDNSSLIAIGTDVAVNNAKSEVEKFIFLLNFFRPDFKNSRKSPLTGAVRNISVTTQKDTALALVTYKYQGTYPQLWSIRLKPDPYKSHFTYVQSYFSKATADFSGRGCFGGLNDSYVCCSSQEGEIFVWNRVTGLLIGRINFVDDEHVKFFACNKLDYPGFQCASGAVDGLLSLWTASDVERTSESQDIIEGLPGRIPLGSPDQILPMLDETKAYID